MRGPGLCNTSYKHWQQIGGYSLSTVPAFTSLSPLSLSDRRDTRDKWSFAYAVTPWTAGSQ